MNRSSEVAFIKKSGILSIPFAGTLIYKLQKSLYQKGLINTVYVSLKDNPERNPLVNTVTGKSKYIICERYQFVSFLYEKKGKLVADFLRPKKLRKQSKKVIEDVAWALIRSDYITYKSLKSFGDFVPSTFPVFKKNLPKQDSLLNILTIFSGRKTIEVIVWDLDGTLFFSPKSAKKMKNIFTGILSDQNKISVEKARDILSERKSDSSWSSIVAEKTGLTEKKILTLLENKIDRSKYVRKDAKLLEMFNKLKNYRHIILTNSNLKNTINTLKGLGFKNLDKVSVYPFEKIFSLDNLKAPKPDRNAFYDILKYTNLPPEKHLMVGDFEKTDILPAKALKFRTCKIGYKSLFSDYNSETVYDIPEILKDN